MAGQSQNLATGILQTSTKVSLYSVPSGIVTSTELVLTNISTARPSVNVLIFDGSVDYLLVKVNLPGGIGKRVRVLSLPDVKLNPGFEVRLELNGADPVNYFLSGTETDVS
jgi:hypothetical protein